ncbi:hypothetical protein JW796_04725 [Candidatus Dojkabacteria bacterium]|nr:hypothetical protein [Candidatus Dojkabacteria bacterium]
MGGNLRPRSDEMGDGIETEKFLRLKDFDHAYELILELEDNLHGFLLPDDKKTENLNTLKNIMDGKFILCRREDPWGMNLLSEQASTAILVFNTRNTNMSSGEQNTVSIVNEQFNAFYEAGDTGGMVRSINRLGWLAESCDQVIARSAESAQETIVSQFKDYFARTKKASA